jgi:hypothetical protein
MALGMIKEWYGAWDVIDGKAMVNLECIGHGGATMWPWKHHFRNIISFWLCLYTLGNITIFC